MSLRHGTNVHAASLTARYASLPPMHSATYYKASTSPTGVTCTCALLIRCYKGESTCLGKDSVVTR